MCIISDMCGRKTDVHYFSYVWKLKKKNLKWKLTHKYRDQRCSYQEWVKCVEGINSDRWYMSLKSADHLVVYTDVRL